MQISLVELWSTESAFDRVFIVFDEVDCYRIRQGDELLLLQINNTKETENYINSLLHKDIIVYLRLPIIHHYCHSSHPYSTADRGGVFTLNLEF